MVNLVQQQLAKGIRLPVSLPEPEPVPQPARPQLTLTLAGTDPSAIKVPYDIPTMKEKLFIWLSTAVDHLNQDWSGVEHCWKETDLLRAW